MTHRSSEHRLLHFRGPETPREMPEESPESLSSRMRDEQMRYNRLESQTEAMAAMTPEHTAGLAEIREEDARVRSALALVQAQAVEDVQKEIDRA